MEFFFAIKIRGECLELNKIENSPEQHKTRAKIVVEKIQQGKLLKTQMWNILFSKSKETNRISYTKIARGKLFLGA